MNKYLAFNGDGFSFMLPTENIVELFDANASAEDLQAVMVGDNEQVYWRGVLSALLDINNLMRSDNNDLNDCFIVCKGTLAPEKYFILKVKEIVELLDLDSSQFRSIEINNPALANVSNQVCILDKSEQLFFVLHEFEKLFNGIEKGRN